MELVAEANSFIIIQGENKPMANEQNLIPNNKRTPNERRENAKKAGIKSGEARRKRKTLREELLALLETKKYQEKISLAILEKACNGDTKAFEIVRDTIGEKPSDKLELDQDKPFEVNISIKK